MQLYKILQPEKKIVHWHYGTKQQDANLQDKHCAETFQFNEKYKEFNPAFLTMMKRYESIRERYLSRVNVEKHPTVRNLSRCTIHTLSTIPHGSQAAGTRARRSVRCVKHAWLSLTVTDWASPVGFVLYRDGRLHLAVYYRRPDTFAERDSNLIRRVDKRTDSLAKAKMISTLEASYGYCQIKVDVRA